MAVELDLDMLSCDHLSAENHHLCAINAELVKALEAIHSHLSNGDNCPNLCAELARAALARAKGAAE